MTFSVPVGASGTITLFAPGTPTQSLGGWPDRLIVQSWEEVNHLKVLPYNLPDTDAFSHTGLVRAVQEQVAALA